jgi:hypothetical protein
MKQFVSILGTLLLYEKVPFVGILLGTFVFYYGFFFIKEETFLINI